MNRKSYQNVYKILQKWIFFKFLVFSFLTAPIMSGAANTWENYTKNHTQYLPFEISSPPAPVRIQMERVGSVKWILANNAEWVYVLRGDGTLHETLAASLPLPIYLCP